MIVVKRLNKDSLKQIIDLSVEIFNPTKEELDRYHDQGVWLSLLDNGAVMLGAYVNNKLAGFVFSRRDSPTHFHLWHAGVLPSMRGQGVMKQLMRSMEKIAHEERVTLLTANTYQNKFPIMFQLLLRYGFVLDHQSADEKEEGRNIKSYFKKNLDKD